MGSVLNGRFNRQVADIIQSHCLISREPLMLGCHLAATVLESPWWVCQYRFEFSIRDELSKFVC